MPTEQLVLPGLQNPQIAKLIQERARLQAATHAPRTLTAYAHDWKRFSAWCETQSRSNLPASTDTVSLYMAHVLAEGRKVASALRYSSAISFYHREAGRPSPVVQEIFELLKGAQRIRREQPVQRAPLEVRQLRRIAAKLTGRDIETVRNRALLLFGFASSLRRSSIAALKFSDVKFDKRGLLVSVEREKQNQDGPPRILAIPTGKSSICPVKALKKWMKTRGDWEGPLFTSFAYGKDGKPRYAINVRIGEPRIARVVQEAVAALGIASQDYGAHSMRAGFVTEALNRGVGEIRVAAHTGHRSLASLRRYFRPSDPFRANACGALGCLCPSRISNAPHLFGAVLFRDAFPAGGTTLAGHLPDSHLVLHWTNHKRMRAIAQTKSANFLSRVTSASSAPPSPPAASGSPASARNPARRHSR